MRSARRSKHSGCRLLVLGHVYVGTRRDSQKVSAATDGHRPPPALHFYDFRPGMEAHGPCRPLRRVSGRGRPKRQATTLHSPGHRLGRTGVEKALLQHCRTHAETPAGVHRDVARAAQAAFLRKRLANALEAWLPASQQGVLRVARGLKNHHCVPLCAESVQQLLFVRRQHPFEKPLQLPAPVRNNTARVAYIRKDDIKVAPVAQVRVPWRGLLHY